MRVARLLNFMDRTVCGGLVIVTTYIELFVNEFKNRTLIAVFNVFMMYL